MFEYPIVNVIHRGPPRGYTERTLIYLSPGWAAFGHSDCPDKAPFPHHFHRTYLVPEEVLPRVIGSFADYALYLNEKMLVPTKENYNRIFIELEDIVSESWNKV